MQDDNRFWEGSGAAWICQEGAWTATNLYLQFARIFEVSVPESLCLRITASSQYQVAINGVVLGRGPAVSYKTRQYFHEYVVSRDALREGRNCIAVLLHHDGEGTKTRPGFRYGKPGLLVHLQGTDWALTSDASWRVRRVSVLFAAG